MHGSWIEGGEKVEMKTFSLQKEMRGTCIIPTFEGHNVKVKEGQEKGVESSRERRLRGDI